MSAADLLTSDFATLPDILREHGRERGGRVAVADERATLTYAELDALMDRIAAALQRDGVAQGQSVAIIAAASIEYAALFMGALRAGCVAAPLAPSSTPESLAVMIADCGAPIVFVDGENAAAIAGQPIAAKQVRLDTEEFQAWLAPEGARSQPVTIALEHGFNIIYSSGTTGTPKGIVQSHKMRWAHIGRNSASGFDEAVTMTSTPLYSNTTLVSFLPTLGWGGTSVLMKKFDARRFLELAEKHRATHTMLVPVQYQRIMALPDFDTFDLSSFKLKTSTSAPFSPALKADILARWPGALVEFYGMTEGGASTGLNATEHPDKLHTVGQPLPGHDMRLIDENGNEVPQGEVGEVVGRSPAMMTGYHGRQQATADAEWHDKQGNRFIRHGDIGRFDEDGFLILMDRKKDLIISGGFNIYPVDLEAVLKQHPAVQECTVIGVPSEAWGETPVGFYVPNTGVDASADEIIAWTNAQLGKTQRLSALHAIDELPRSAIGKVLKRELRERLAKGEV
ncbi:class I adenylate-forming enzyme family protein [Sphingomonas sp.]|jgi:acyl-CoA synthetase (AMP-forming)/AMP-acid ligase II|uniref:class I adenylate-forming enzyme family protein n=1 Tax=Sphingomonas sp. TaxID=28214 RepID=UPI002E32F435|nr:class I adenylate-forming enzyme family protein [Sphingomonas sp.]HEX4694770.1 class I adenylate-forming enzyme family protein [Sphingomonas sp.]